MEYRKIELMTLDDMAAEYVDLVTKEINCEYDPSAPRFTYADHMRKKELLIHYLDKSSSANA